jgi:hypothetical protein
MKAVLRRAERLEGQIVSADRPQRHLRIVVLPAGARPSLDDATCHRTLCPDGTLLGLLDLPNPNPGSEELPDEELEEWVDSFPIELVGGRKG